MPPPTIDLIITEISTKITNVGIPYDQENIRSFLTKEVNGDTLTNHLVLVATLSKDRRGLLIYLLTTAKIVKIEITAEGVQSFSSYLKEVTGVNRSLSTNVSGNNARVVVEFLQGNFGLFYPANDTQIDNFFQKVDEAVRNIKVAPNGPKTQTT
jgi:hypothetical protein